MVILTKYSQRWRGDLFIMIDLYSDKNYCLLYEAIENGTCEEFEYADELGTVRHLFIKKLIPLRFSDTNYYDLITPYGYGGPVIKKLVIEDKKEELVSRFSEAFHTYCTDHQIVSEFVRFHPIKNNAKDFESCYDVHFRRLTTGVTLKGSEDPVLDEFSSSTRKRIRKALKDGVTYRITVNPDNLDEFKNIYLQTMKRIDADPLYFFDDEYFSNCLKYFGENLILVEALFESEVIGAELHFLSGTVIHTHLSGSSSDHNYLSPVYVMTYAIVLWAKEQGVELIHSGGGQTSEPDDSLYLFKKKFGKNTEFNYYIGYKIWNEEVYQQLTQLAKLDPSTEFFPSYRQPF